MKKYISILILGFFTSCEEVIEVQLENAEPLLVIEASIGQGEFSVVNISLSATYFDDVQAEKVEDAQVTITDVASGLSEELAYEGNGVFKGSEIIGEVLKEYELKINYQNKVYSSVSTLYPRAEINGIGFNQVNGGGFFSDTGLVALIDFNSAHSEAYYALEYITSEDEFEIGYSIQEAIDSGTNSLYVNPQAILSSGDSVTLVIKSIDKNHYDYLFGLNDLIGNSNQGGSATPYNPVSRFNPTALGYFTAYSMIVKDTIALP